MRKAEYAYPRMPFATSYQKNLLAKVEQMKLMGAKIEIKEYTSRPPGWYTDQGGFTGAELKKLDLILVVIKNPGKSGRVGAFNTIATEHYYKTIKVAERADADTMQACADQLLEHVNDFVKRKTNK